MKRLFNQGKQAYLFIKRKWFHITSVVSILLVSSVEFASADTAGQLNGFNAVANSSGTDVMTTIAHFTSNGMKIFSAIAAAFTLFHLVKSGLAMQTGGGKSKEEAMGHLKWTIIGGVVALGAYFFASLIYSIANGLTGATN